jgi:hypothetical protein
MGSEAALLRVMYTLIKVLRPRNIGVVILYIASIFKVDFFKARCKNLSRGEHNTGTNTELYKIVSRKL